MVGFRRAPSRGAGGGAAEGGGYGVGEARLPQSGPLRQGLGSGDGVPIRYPTERSAGPISGAGLKVAGPGLNGVKEASPFYLFSGCPWRGRRGLLVVSQDAPCLTLTALSVLDAKAIHTNATMAFEILPHHVGTYGAAY